IIKTALGAEKSVDWSHFQDVYEVISVLKKQGYTIAALEQSANSIKLPDYNPPAKIAILVGREVEGVEPDVLAQCDLILEIPMFGKKESFNVVQAAAMALYHCKFVN
ncbi:MAG: TrmH family RNA methyltransferase, partial [Candidatus Saccharimonadales bacterium]